MFHAPKLALASLILCLFAEEVSAGLILLGNDDAHISEGAKSKYNFSGKISASDSSGTNAFRGSLTLYDPFEGAGVQSPVIWAATSKHVVLADYNNNGSIYTNLRATFESNAYSASVFHNVAEVYLHPTRDFAILRFEVPVQNVTPVELFRGTAGIGTEATIVGNGLTTVVGSGITYDTGDRRVGYDVIDNINISNSDGLHEFATTFNSSFGNNFRPYQIGLNNGYSGGSLLVDNQWLATNDSISLADGYGRISYYDKVPIDFSDSIVTSVPEPGSVALLAASSSLLLWRRLRRKAA